MYVNEDTVDMGQEGREALNKLFQMALEQGILNEMPQLDIIQAN